MPRAGAKTRSGGLRSSAKVTKPYDVRSSALLGAKRETSVESQDSGYGSLAPSRESSVETGTVEHGSFGGPPIREFSKLGKVNATHGLTTHEKLCNPENDWTHPDWRPPDDEDDDWEECDNDINQQWIKKTQPQGPYYDKKYHDAVWWRLSRKRRVYIVKKSDGTQEIHFKEYYQTDQEKPRWDPSDLVRLSVLLV